MTALRGRVVCSGLLAGILAAGCATDSTWEWPAGENGSLKVPTPESAIVGVRTLGYQQPWISFDPDYPEDPGGFKLTVFLEGAKTAKGVRGEGTLKVYLYRLRTNRQGRRQRDLVSTWEYNQQEAVRFLKRASTWGWGYFLRLNWGDADVYGDEIQAAVRFVKADGDVIFGHPVTMRVPPLLNERPPNISEPEANTLLGRRS